MNGCGTLEFDSCPNNNNIFCLIYNLTHLRMFISKVWTHDDSRLLWESNLASRQPRRAPHHAIQATTSEVPRSLRDGLSSVHTMTCNHTSCLSVLINKEECYCYDVSESKESPGWCNPAVWVFQCLWWMWCLDQWQSMGAYLLIKF